MRLLSLLIKPLPGPGQDAGQRPRHSQGQQQPLRWRRMGLSWCRPPRLQKVSIATLLLLFKVLTPHSSGVVTKTTLPFVSHDPCLPRPSTMNATARVMRQDDLCSFSGGHSGEEDEPNHSYRHDGPTRRWRADTSVKNSAQGVLKRLVERLRPMRTSTGGKYDHTLCLCH